MDIRDLHNQAMELVDLADSNNRQGEKDIASQRYREAFELEKRAAMKAYADNVGEPTISVLLRSAATIAVRCNENREAEKLINLALSGEPPFEIAEELRDLYENVNFYRHLEIKGEILSNDEFQIVIAGSGVGYGYAPEDEIMGRITTIKNIAQRTAERKAGYPYRTSGSPKINLAERMYMSAPQAASMAFRIKFGTPQEQTLPGFGYEDIITDIVENIELVNNNDIDILKERISNDAYFKHFMTQTKELAPDGNTVKIFGITSISNGNVRPTILTVNKSQLSETIVKNDPLLSEIETIETLINERIDGILKKANANNNTVELITKDKKKTQLKVPDGLSDIVKKYWDEDVTVTYSSNKKTKILLDIN